MFVNMVQKESFIENMVHNKFDTDFIYLHSFLTTKIHFYLKIRRRI